MVLMVYGWARTPAPAITWQYVQEQEVNQLPIETVRTGPFDLTVYANNAFITERLLGNPLQPDTLSAYWMLICLALAMVTTLAVITTLSRFWYMVGAGLFIAFVAALRLDVLEMFGSSSKAFIVITLLVYVPLSYYFNALQPRWSFVVRWISFLVVTVMLALIVAFFAGVPRPFLHLAATGVVPALILTVIFIVTVAHELPASFVAIATAGRQARKSLNHFLFLTAIYFVNLALIYANRFEFLNWNFIYVNLFLLLAISGLLGVWGIRQRQPQMAGIIEAEPFAVYLFLAVGAVAFALLGYFFANANDAGLDALGDIIIFTHLGFGIIFITYVISNFFDALGNNLAVHRVLYKPTRMPYFTFRFGGIVATLAFVFYNTWQAPVHNARSSYYNAVGDLYNLLGNRKLARGFYEQGGVYGFLNHHSNYAIADLEAARGDFNNERRFLSRAVDRRPTEMAWLNLSQTYQRERNLLEANLILRDAAEDFPESGAIQNTRGLLYARLHIVDSAMLMLTAASNSVTTAATAKTNILSVAAQHNFEISPDSLYQLLDNASPAVKANALGFANQRYQSLDFEVNADQDTTLNLFSATLLNNYIINHLGRLDTTFLNRAITLARNSNTQFGNGLLFSSALALYAAGEVGQAFSLMENVAAGSDDAGRFNHVLALWSLQQDDDIMARRYIDFAVTQNFSPAWATSAIVLAEGGSINESIIRWDSVRNTSDSLERISNAMMRVLTTTRLEAMQLNDEDKYLYSRYMAAPLDSTFFNALLASFRNDDEKARAIVDRATALYQLDEAAMAIKTLQRLTNLRIRDPLVLEDFRKLELLLAANQKDYRLLQDRLKSMSFAGYRTVEKQYFDMLIRMAANDSTGVGQQMEWLATANPFFDDAVVAAADYFSGKPGNRLKAYNILVEALHRHPASVKINKAYALEAAQLEFDDYVATALEQLHALLPPPLYNKFISDHAERLR